MTYREVTIRASVMSTYKDMCKKLPPVASVAHGAMVIHDDLFSQAELRGLQQSHSPES